MKKLLVSLLVLSKLSFAAVNIYSHPCDGSCYEPDQTLGGATPMAYVSSLMNADVEQQRRLNTDKYWIIVSQQCTIQKHTFSKDIAICTAHTR